LEAFIVRILLVEDFAPYRSLIRSLLGKNTELCVICEVADGLDGVAKAQELKPDVILLDVGLPGLSGLEVARRVRDIVPAPKIVFLTQETDVEVLREALRLGACGYVIKQQAETELLSGLAAVLEGKLFVSSGLPGEGLVSNKTREPNQAN
jgi:DNA-binding NarL/FixJ family response regulator